MRTKYAQPFACLTICYKEEGLFKEQLPNYFLLEED